MNRHQYIVDIFGSVVKETNKALCKNYTEWNNIDELPSSDGFYLFSYVSSSPVSYNGLVLRTGDLFQIKNGSVLYGNKVFYQYGHPLEIVNTLTEMSKEQSISACKYPILALFTDISEDKTDPKFYCKVNDLHLIIATLTDNTYLADQRIEQNFKPILHPIYDEFINQLSKNRNIEVDYTGSIPHISTDRLYWGRNGLFGNDSNIFNDYIDCIEITKLKLNIKKQNYECIS